MELSLRRILGLYFLVISLQYIPAAVFMLAVENPMGPDWILPAVPFAQGVVTACAGLVLLRARSTAADVPGTIVVPSVDLLLQVVGVNFAVGGLVGTVRPLSGVLFLNEVWSVSVAGELAAAAAAVLAGGFLITRSSIVMKMLEGLSGH